MSCHLYRYPWPSFATSPYRSSPLAGLLFSSMLRLFFPSESSWEIVISLHLISFVCVFFFIISLLLLLFIIQSPEVDYNKIRLVNFGVRVIPMSLFLRLGHNIEESGEDMSFMATWMKHFKRSESRKDIWFWSADWEHHQQRDEGHCRAAQGNGSCVWPRWGCKCFRRNTPSHMVLPKCRCSWILIILSLSSCGLCTQLIWKEANQQQNIVDNIVDVMVVMNEKLKIQAISRVGILLKAVFKVYFF